MKSQLILDKAGRIVLPKPLREELNLEPGDALELQRSGEQITLRPVRGTGPLTKELGVWVFRTGQPLPAEATDEVLRQIREERDRANRGDGE
jgi:AbrB family looped-hinge helix DNA binding protein